MDSLEIRVGGGGLLVAAVVGGVIGSAIGYGIGTAVPQKPIVENADGSKSVWTNENIGVVAGGVVGIWAALGGMLLMNRYNTEYQEARRPQGTVTYTNPMRGGF